MDIGSWALGSTFGMLFGAFMLCAMAWGETRGGSSTISPDRFRKMAIAYGLFSAVFAIASVLA